MRDAGRRPIIGRDLVGGIPLTPSLSPNWITLSEKRKSHPVAGVIGVIVIAIVVAVAFLSCASHGSTIGAQVASSTTARPAAPPPVESAVQSNPDIQDTLYTAVLDENHVPYTSRDGVIHLAHVICDDLDSGSTVTDVELKMLGANSDMQAFTAAQLGTIVGSAVSAYCPAHRPELGN